LISCALLRFLEIHALDVWYTWKLTNVATGSQEHPLGEPLGGFSCQLSCEMGCNATVVAAFQQGQLGFGISDAGWLMPW
jgi:hypothetical protein